jgi:hypothetical protein
MAQSFHSSLQAVPAVPMTRSCARSPWRLDTEISPAPPYSTVPLSWNQAQQCSWTWCLHLVVVDVARRSDEIDILPNVSIKQSASAALIGPNGVSDCQEHRFTI